MKKRTHHICVVVFYTMLASVTTLSAQANDVLTCPNGTESFTEYRLFFGRSQGNIGGGERCSLAGVSR